MSCVTWALKILQFIGYFGYKAKGRHSFDHLPNFEAI
jgi:hypothetical protein